MSELLLYRDRLIARAVRLNSGCLVLPNHADHPEVYPSVRVGNRKTMRANRLVWEATYGPTELFVCHTCDYPRCFEITHLFVGTQSDNMQDMASKGRHVVPSGEKHPNWEGGVSKDMRSYRRNWIASLSPEKLEERRRRHRISEKARRDRKKLAEAT